ncbi:MAG TPA: hypothetical protein VH560_16920 [Polyangia bacterium]|nr:hypothetical protein [Polyangia bacterium]
MTGLEDEGLDNETEALEQAKVFQEAIRSAWTRDFVLRSKVLDRGIRASCAAADLRRWSSTYARTELEATDAQRLIQVPAAIAA